MAISSAALLSSGTPDWISSTMSAIQASRTVGGMLGALDNARKGNPAASFKSAANAFALIAQNDVSSATSFYAQLAAQAQQNRQDELMQRVFKELARTSEMVKPKNVLDSVVYFADGSYINTDTNIMTMVNGKQYDTLTGAEYNDPAFIIDMGNGSWLNSQTNVLTLADGTRIDTVTGLKVEDLVEPET